MCPHGFNARKRDKEHTVAPSLLWADLDERDPRELKIKPTMAWETSPGRYAALWVTDRPVSDSLNQRWSYYCGADKGGWDFSQVLRLLPGTTNYKYPSKPKVKLLWGDGDSVRVDDIEALAPRADGKTNGSAAAADIYKRVEHLLKPADRRLINAKVATGDRSKVLFGLGARMVECGVSLEQTLEIIKHTVWNKFKDRRDEDQRLREGLEKPVDKKLNGEKHEETEIEFKSAATLEPRNRTWLWRDWLAQRNYHLLAGVKGAAKSTLTFRLAATVSTGGKWPDGERSAQGAIVLWNGEDDPEETIVPRLMAAGADLSRIFVVSTVKEEGIKRAFDPSTDFEPLKMKISEYNEHADETRKIRLLLLDPVVMILEKGTDSHNDVDVRRGGMQYLPYSAKELDIAILGITHFNKNSSGKAPLDRVLASTAITAIARVIWLAVESPIEADKDRRLLVRGASNIVPKGGGFEYRLKLSSVRLNIEDTTKIEWGEFLEGTPEELLNAKAEEDDSAAIKEWLDGVLADGEKHEVEAVLSAAGARGFIAEDVRRIARRTVKTMRLGMTMYWRQG